MGDEHQSAIQKKLTDLRREGEERDAEHIARQSGYEYVDLRKTPISIEAIELISEEKARKANIVAIQLKVKDLAVAVHDPISALVGEVTKELEAKGYTIKLFISSLSGLTQAWNLYKFVSAGVKGITGKVDIEKQRLEELSAELTTIEAVHDEIVHADLLKITTTVLFEIVLAGALANRASDIHFEAGEKQARIRFRIDGSLHDIFTDLPLKNYGTLISRIKLLSGLKINVRGEAQDGRFTIGLTTKEIEMRVSIIPSEFGETIVMRILDPDSIAIGLEELGLREDDLSIAAKALARPNGLILNTGPTGSGKTTTLYAFLRHVNKSDIKIITVEDPVEYHLPGIAQTQVDPDAGYTFASGLRSILRQDPDVILVGEIRDLETADIAMQASLTGHLVFSTLHTNDALGAVPRLIDLGVKVATIGPALSLIIAQRLVRRLCKECKKPTQVSEELKSNIEKFLKSLPPRVNREKYEHIEMYDAKGCSLCNNTGYKGRIGIMEFFEAGPELEEVILRQVSETALRELAEKQEMVTMQQDGILKTIAGVTTLEEVQEITGPLHW